MRLRISHTTTYLFDQPALYGLQQLRLTPKSRPGHQVVDRWDMVVEGGRIETTFQDQFRNAVSLVSFDPGAHEIRVSCDGEVVVEDTVGVVGKHSGFAPLWFFLRNTARTDPGDQVAALVNTVKDMSDDLPRLHALSAAILDVAPYAIGVTGAMTSAEEALSLKGGVCQDHAHIFISAARMLGYPARYVSGYLMMNDRVHQDASHAWAEAHLPKIGWVGFDISNGYSPDARYVRVATGLDYTDAAPIAGLHYGASGEAMSVDIQVAQQ